MSRSLSYAGTRSLLLRAAGLFLSSSLLGIAQEMDGADFVVNKMRQFA
jgi:hypothetical protein|eukprot:COSAG06_NODE_416_length_15996_cov_260.778637_9_plen_48_part_00